jgi:transcriptional regulator with XRE-family HTH domain
MKPTIPNTLKEHRERLGLRQTDVADKIGMLSSDRISRWEKGLAYPHLMNLFKMAALFQVKPHELYPGLLEMQSNFGALRKHWYEPEGKGE